MAGGDDGGVSRGEDRDELLDLLNDIAVADLGNDGVVSTSRIGSDVCGARRKARRDRRSNTLNPSANSGHAKPTRKRTSSVSSSLSCSHQAPEMTRASSSHLGHRQEHHRWTKSRRGELGRCLNTLARLTLTKDEDNLIVLRSSVRLVRSLAASPGFHCRDLLRFPHTQLGEGRLGLCRIVEQVSTGFVLVVGGSDMRIAFASSSLSQILGFSSCEVIGHSLYRLLHWRDVDQAMAQKSLAESGSESFGAGARRSFTCRMRVKDSQDFLAMHCLGRCGRRTQGDQNDVLTLVCRPLREKKVNPSHRRNEARSFTARLTVEGCFAWVDQDVTAFLGFTPNELVGTSLLERMGSVHKKHEGSHEPFPTRSFVQDAHQPSQYNAFQSSHLQSDSTESCQKQIKDNLSNCRSDRHQTKDFHNETRTIWTQEWLSESLKEVLDRGSSASYVNITTKSGRTIGVKLDWRAFRNPWTKRVDFVAAKFTEQ